MSETNKPWMQGSVLNEEGFCLDFLERHQLKFYDGAFFTPNGRMDGDMELRHAILEELLGLNIRNIPARITCLVELLKLLARVEDFPPQADRVHLANGTLYLDNTFLEGRREIVHSRLPVAYNPEAPSPWRWLVFLSTLLYPEDIPTLQEFMGYCLIPSNKGQRMMVIKGNGGEGKSQIGVVLRSLMGSCMKDGSIGKVSENPFARADLEHVLLMVDDDMRMDALRQTNYVKSIVTASGKMDLERKGRQSYQGYLFARLLAFSNGDLQSLYDHSDGFYRRQLILETKPKEPGRIDDPFLGEDLVKEREGIFLWAWDGLQRLIDNNFHFTESRRTFSNRESNIRSSSNVFDFLEAEDYIRLKADASISSRALYGVYRTWCEDNSLIPMKPKTLSEFLISHQKQYNLEYCNTIVNREGRRVRGFMGLTSTRHFPGE